MLFRSYIRVTFQDQLMRPSRITSHTMFPNISGLLRCVTIQQSDPPPQTTESHKCEKRCTKRRPNSKKVSVKLLFMVKHTMSSTLTTRCRVNLSSTTSMVAINNSISERQRSWVTSKRHCSSAPSNSNLRRNRVSNVQRIILQGTLKARKEWRKVKAESKDCSRFKHKTRSNLDTLLPFPKHRVSSTRYSRGYSSRWVSNLVMTNKP